MNEAHPTAVTSLTSLVHTSERVGASGARRTKVGELAGLLKSLGPADIETAVRYMSGEIPQGRIGITAQALREAATVAASPDPKLTVADVDRTLSAVAALHGAGSAARRREVLRELFARATAEEQRFLIRLLSGELRQGALGGLMLEAIAAAAALPSEAVRRAAMYAPDLGAVARAALSDGAAALAGFSLQLFKPAAPMLAQTAADPGEALDAFDGEAAFEWKMDGARIQAHKSGSEVRIYTRSLNDITAALPEIVDAVRSLHAPALVLDGEAIAMDAAGRPHPFQVTMRRLGRRLDIEALRRELPVRVFFFDCLYADGQSITHRRTRDRYEALVHTVPEALRMPRLVTAQEPRADAFYDAALAAGHEGLMAKSLDAPYEAGNRGASWLKIKRTHTLDLVVLAAEWGHGRRAGKLSNLHLGAVDAAGGSPVMLGKTFKGLTDAMLEWQTRELLARETHRAGGTVHVRPELVVEIAFSDLQASTRYPAGMALRLARVQRYRTDKPAAQADDLDSVRRLFAAQRGDRGSGD
jgi:DNA ligase-1